MYSFEYYRLCSFIDLYICLAFLPAVDLLFNAKLTIHIFQERETGCLLWRCQRIQFQGSSAAIQVKNARTLLRLNDGKLLKFHGEEKKKKKII